MKSVSQVENGDAIDLRPFKGRLKKSLPPESQLISDLLSEPDSLPVGVAEVLIPHYLRRLERELDRYEREGPLVLQN